MVVVAPAMEVEPLVRGLLGRMRRHGRFLLAPALERSQFPLNLSLDHIRVYVSPASLNQRSTHNTQPNCLGHTLIREPGVALPGRVHELLVVQLERVRDGVHGPEHLPQPENDERDGRLGRGRRREMEEDIQAERRQDDESVQEGYPGGAIGGRPEFVQAGEDVEREDAEEGDVEAEDRVLEKQARGRGRECAGEFGQTQGCGGVVDSRFQLVRLREEEGAGESASRGSASGTQRTARGCGSRLDRWPRWYIPP